jgi:hypothetical protein
MRVTVTEQRVTLTLLFSRAGNRMARVHLVALHPPLQPHHHDHDIPAPIIRSLRCAHARARTPPPRQQAGQQARFRQPAPAHRERWKGHGLMRGGLQCVCSGSSAVGYGAGEAVNADVDRCGGWDGV